MYNIPEYDTPELNAFYGRYFATPFNQCVNYGMGINEIHGGDSCDIYITTFNNPFYIEYQVKTIRRFFHAPVNIIVVDTACGLFPEVQARLVDICRKQNKVAYIEAPDNYYQHADPAHFDPSMKLGVTLNWIYYNVFLTRKVKYFGFLDHDCFLFRDIDLRAWLDQKGMYGLLTHSHHTEAWNLHVIANFFKYDYVAQKALDFRPSYFWMLDTGGNNYQSLYQPVKMEDYRLSHRCIRYTPDDIARKDAVQHYEIIDECWFHVASSGQDQLCGDNAKKLLYAKGFLDARLLMHRN